MAQRNAARAPLALPQSQTSIKQAYEYCRQMSQRFGTTFYWGSLLLPPSKRRAAWAIYAFCRQVDNLVDNADGSYDIHTQLHYWHTSIAGAFQGIARDPITLAWVDMLARYEIPLQIALDLLDGVSMDVNINRYNTFAELREYCYRVASTVGLLTSSVFGYETEETLRHAIDLGIAMQLTNILRDVGEDAHNNRIYLPQEDLCRFGYSEVELLAGVINPAFIALMEFQMARADEYYRRGNQGICQLSPDSQFAVLLSSVLYRKILTKIRHNGYDVFTKRAYVPFYLKVLAAPKYWLQLKLS